LIGAILAGTPKLAGALCRGRSELWDSDDLADIDDAIAICHQCPALEACAEWSAGLKHNEANGTLAGEFREWISHPSQARKEIPA
jgi:hypothetical protein